MATQWKPVKDPVTGRLAGSRKLPRYTPEPGSLKTCSRCHEDKPIEEFGVRRCSRDGADYYCKRCRAELGRVVYQARKYSVHLRRWKRSHGDTLLALFAELLEAAEEARHHGLWRGRLAIRAYKRLGDALDALQRDGSYEAEAMEAKPTPLPVAPASDADWDPKRHGRQPWLAKH